MKISVSDHRELKTLLDSLAWEIVYANTYHRLYCDLLDSLKDHEREFNQARTFWNLTLSALRDVRNLGLCRIYDKHSRSLNLYNLLETIKANTNYFKTESFKQRLKDNPFVESLAELDRMPDPGKLEEDIEFASPRNALVKKLLIWRNKIIAHHDPEVPLGRRQILEDKPLSRKEIEQLLDAAFKIFNRYSNLFCASSWSRYMAHHDEYKSVLKFMKMGMDKWDEDIKKQIQ